MMHRTYRVTGELLAERAPIGKQEPIQDSILVDMVICGATQEASAAWQARHVATLEAGYRYAGWLTIKIEELPDELQR